MEFKKKHFFSKNVDFLQNKKKIFTGKYGRDQFTEFAHICYMLVKGLLIILNSM